ncbi:MAG: cytochrome C biogenesis protein [Spirochaetes bacterium]|nr:cytochrome C biogenesis protein [Spirochaetota bacterium]
MLNSLFTFIDAAVKGSPLIALSAAFLWGILSILLSPCHLSSIPLIIGFMSGQKDISVKKAFITSSLFALGILITMAILGVLTMTFGFMVFSRIGIYGTAVVGILFIVVGIYLLEILPLPSIPALSPNMKSRGYLAAFIMGLIFGIALGPCTFAFMMPVLGAAAAAAAQKPVYAFLLVFLYAVGHCAVIVAAGSSFEAVEKYLKWNEQSRVLSLIKKICALLIIAAGIYLLRDVIKIFWR